MTSNFPILLTFIFVNLLWLHISADPHYDHVNCNGRGSGWDGSKCASCISPWEGDTCNEEKLCYGGSWNGTDCTCVPWLDPVSNCTYDTNLDYTCYYGSAQNDTGYGPYCSCFGYSYGYQCENIYDYKDCVTGTVWTGSGNGSAPWSEPTCKCPDETYELNTGYCECASGYSYGATFGDPCVENKEDPTQSNNESKTSDWDKTRTTFSVVGAFIGVVSFIATVFKLRAWAIDQRQKGETVNLKTFICCVPCMKFAINRCSCLPCLPSKKGKFYTGNNSTSQINSNSQNLDPEQPPVPPPRSNLIPNTSPSSSTDEETA